MLLFVQRKCIINCESWVYSIVHSFVFIAYKLRVCCVELWPLVIKRYHKIPQFQTTKSVVRPLYPLKHSIAFFFCCFILGELAINSDSVRQLQAHSNTSRSTYAYYFTENYKLPTPLWPAMPSWIKKSAAHLDELPFVFGTVYNIDEDIWTGKQCFYVKIVLYLTFEIISYSFTAIV